jgi:hypothetical protein
MLDERTPGEVALRVSVCDRRRMRVQSMPTIRHARRAQEDERAAEDVGPVPRNKRLGAETAPCSITRNRSRRSCAAITRFGVRFCSGERRRSTEILASAVWDYACVFQCQPTRQIGREAQQRAAGSIG